MKKFFTTIALGLLCMATMTAQEKKSNKTADAIVGNYESVQGGEPFKVSITKNSNGSYKAQIYWIADSIDKSTGKIKLDAKNPEKSLRNTPSNRIVLFDGLKYNAEKQQWDGTKIYDPQRGLKANVTGSFQSDGRLMLKGTIMGIGEKVYWKPIKK